MTCRKVYNFSTYHYLSEFTFLVMVKLSKKGINRSVIMEQIEV